MLKKNLYLLRDYIIRHSKVAFPVIVIAAVALTVVLALNASNADVMATEQEAGQESEVLDIGEAEDGTAIREISDAPMVESTDPALYTLMETYYNAYANGDVDTIRSIKNYVSDTDEIEILEMSKYVESYPFLKIYTKDGPFKDSYIVYVYLKLKWYLFDDFLTGMETFYVCTDENGELFINNDRSQLEEVSEYLDAINKQDDVVELKNLADVECVDEFIINIDLFDYSSQVASVVSEAIGEALAAQIAESVNAGASEEGITEEGAESTEGTGESSPEEGSPDVQPPVQEGPVYAKATTTVNVRSSDSEQADRINRVTGGERVQVLEQKANGWSKVLYENREGYIKSEYLELEAVIQGGEVIGTLRAESNVNIRAAASETADKIGIVAGGDTVNLIATENGWHKIAYNGLVGYVRADLLQ